MLWWERATVYLCVQPHTPYETFKVFRKGRQNLKKYLDKPSVCHIQADQSELLLLV